MWDLKSICLVWNCKCYWHHKLERTNVLLSCSSSLCMIAKLWYWKWNQLLWLWWILHWLGWAPHLMLLLLGLLFSGWILAVPLKPFSTKIYLSPFLELSFHIRLSLSVQRASICGSCTSGGHSFSTISEKLQAPKTAFNREGLNSYSCCFFSIIVIMPNS